MFTDREASSYSVQVDKDQTRIFRPRSEEISQAQIKTDWIETQEQIPCPNNPYPSSPYSNFTKKVSAQGRQENRIKEFELNSKLVEITDHPLPCSNTDAIIQEVMGVMRIAFVSLSGFVPQSQAPLWENHQTPPNIVCSIKHQAIVPQNCQGHKSKRILKACHRPEEIKGMWGLNMMWHLE